MQKIVYIAAYFAYISLNVVAEGMCQIYFRG